ncbi:type II secretion system minor pseudopilin GspH [Spongiibacter sp.]|uniref:type II secretion system minor pseudopilin GspH n=1 Tax=Spongiibacter sp. TaxID=2024860 RepID=UPI003561B51F
MTSLTGRSNQSGFSLLELLVVIFIIGLMSGVAVLTLPAKDGDALLRENRAVLLLALRGARAEAVFSGRSLGLLWEGDSGRFMVRSTEGWQPIDEGKLSRPLRLDEALRSEILLGGEPLRLPRDDSARVLTPQIVFLGDGQLSPFEWRLYAVDGSRLSVDDSLRIEVDK